MDVKHLRSVKVLGEGAFGKVFLQEDPVTHEKFALKQISKRGAAFWSLRNVKNILVRYHHYRYTFMIFYEHSAKNYESF